MYPKFHKENNEAPITFRVITSPASGIELTSLEGFLTYREVKNQVEISRWESDKEWNFFCDCDKSEMLEAFIQCETYIGDKRVWVEKLFNGGIELYQ